MKKYFLYHIPSYYPLQMVPVFLLKKIPNSGPYPIKNVHHQTDTQTNSTDKSYLACAVTCA